MSRKTFKTLFLVKPSRVSKKGESPVFMCITVGEIRIVESRVNQPVTQLTYI